MTYSIYTQQALSRYNLPRLKRIATELGITPTGDKRGAQTWVNAILTHQSTQIQIAQPAAPEPLRTVEISFYDHEYYAGDKLIASITHDDNLTQPWVVIVNGIEQFRANTWARCHRFIQWHHQDGTLNEPAQVETPPTTENLIMAHIFTECEKYGFEILDDGIYQNEEKLGEVGCTDGNWWVKRGCSGQQQYSKSVMDAVRSLSMVDVVPTAEYLLPRPLEQMTTEELQQLLSAEVADYEQLLDRPFDELTSEGWEMLRGYAPVAESRELVTA